MVAPISKFYTISTVLFNKYRGVNVAFKNCMSHFSMSIPTKATDKMANGNTGHAKRMGIILCQFPNCSIIYIAVLVYYCPGHPSNTISSGALTFYVGFKKVTSEPLENCDFVDLQGCSWRSPCQTQNNLYYLEIEIFKSNLQRDSNIFVPIVCALSKNI